MDLEPTTQPPKMAIIGCGPGAAEYVTEAARRAAAGADVLVGSRRLLDLFPMCCEERIHVDADIPSLLERIEALLRGRAASRRTGCRRPGTLQLGAESDWALWFGGNARSFRP